MDLHILYNYMNQSSSWEAKSCSASQEFPCALWPMKVHPSVYNNSPLSPILSQINPVQTLPSYFFKISWSIHGFFLSGFLTAWGETCTKWVHFKHRLVYFVPGFELKVSKLKFCPISNYMILRKIFFLSNLHRINITVAWHDLQQ
jgi:hypothetical protein